MSNGYPNIIVHVAAKIPELKFEGCMKPLSIDCIVFYFAN